MTLSDRDFFASQALYGLMLTSKNNPCEMGKERLAELCEKSFDIAELMVECAYRRSAGERQAAFRLRNVDAIAPTYNPNLPK